VYRVLEGKYFVDELYAALFVRPLAWVSEHVFLRIGDRMIIDGTLNGLAAFAQRSAGWLGRVQTGSLQLYALLVMLGMVGALLWSWRHV
jgi:NADH-quinone oxidoreductase subunit L